MKARRVIGACVVESCVLALGREVNEYINFSLICQEKALGFVYLPMDNLRKWRVNNFLNVPKCVLRFLASYMLFYRG